MPYSPITIDESIGRTDGARARVPEGYYLIECERLDPTAEDFEKNTGIWNYIRIVQGPDANPGLGVGGRMRDFNLMGKENAFFAIGITLKAFGLEPIAKQLEASAKAGKPLQLPLYRDFVNFTASLNQRMAGRRAVALIADQPGNNGRPFSGIESLEPETDWVHRKTSALSTPQVGPQQPPLGGLPVQPVGPNGGSPLDSMTDWFANLDAAQ